MGKAKGSIDYEKLLKDLAAKQAKGETEPFEKREVYRTAKELRDLGAAPPYLTLVWSRPITQKE